MTTFKKPTAVADVDAEAAKIRAQMQAAASEQATAQAGIDTLTEAMRLGLEAGNDTTEIEGRIVAARVGLERLALRHGMLERVGNEKARVLKEKRHRARIEALTQAEAAARTGLAAIDEEIIEDLLRVSKKFSTRSQAEHDTFALAARLQHIGGLPRGVGDLAWDEAPLVAEFLRRHAPEATRPVSLGEQPWRPFALSIPVLTPDRVTAAIVADDEANALA